MAKKFILIDGNSLLFRAYYATALPGREIMRTSTGIPTNALYSFALMINRILESAKIGDYFAVGFDTGKKTFRHEKDTSYKANRKPAPDDLKAQMPIVREYLDVLKIKRFEIEGYEGDDIIGTFSKIATENKIETHVYTSDRDFLQLVNDYVTVEIMKSGTKDILAVTPEKMVEIYGYKPPQIVDFKAIAGDSSDNISGIPNIGEKTATDLIIKYGCLDEIYKHIDELKPRHQELFTQGKDIAYHCYEMATICKDVPIPVELKDLEYNGTNFDDFSNFANKYELKKILAKLPEIFKIQEVKKRDYKVVKDLEILDDEVALTLDLDYKDYHSDPLLGIGIHLKNRDSLYYIKEEDLKGANQFRQSIIKTKISTIDKKALLYVLDKYDIKNLNVEFDLFIAAYLLDSSLKNPTQEIVFAIYSKTLPPPSETGMLFSSNNFERTTLAAYYINEIKTKIIEELKANNLFDLYSTIELPLSSILFKMEKFGFPLHKKELEDFGKEMNGKLDSIQKEIFSLIGKEINLNSPKQIKEYLQNDLQIIGEKDSTSFDDLNKIKDRHPFIPLLLQNRKYSKIVQTYVNGFLPYIKGDSTVHCVFNQTGTETGRLSCQYPNLQNISVRDEEGKLMRKAFYYDDPNYMILSLDYSAIELRVLASLANVKALVDAFNNDEDVHSLTAIKLFGTSEGLARRKAKVVNFGIVYGMSPFGLKEELEIPMFEANKIIKDFDSTYPEIKKYLDEVYDGAKKNHYVSTLFNRRRVFRENDASYSAQGSAKRQIENATIQGTAADILKLAMIKVDEVLSSSNLDCTMISTIHDELLFKVHKNDVEKATSLIKDAMENAAKLKVKLKVEGGAGRTWYDAK